jgi:hypothetical protein
LQESPKVFLKNADKARDSSQLVAQKTTVLLLNNAELGWIYELSIVCNRSNVNTGRLVVFLIGGL